MPADTMASDSSPCLVAVTGDLRPTESRRSRWFRIRTIPSWDHAFDAHVHAVVSDLPEPDPALLQNVLRSTYPLVLVRPRDLAGEQENVWYVYREGRWVPNEPGKQPGGAGELTR
jgi:hypothetical protein